MWVPTLFSRNRDRLIDWQIAEAFMHAVKRAADQRGLLSHEHFAVDGTLLEAWASHTPPTLSHFQLAERQYHWVSEYNR